MNRRQKLTDPVPGYLEDLLAHLPSPCRRALDVGCGVGELSRRLATTCDEVLGIDRAEHMIAKATALSTGVSNVSFELGDFLDCPLAEDSFDLVLSVASLHHMDFDRALAKMRDVTRPGGVVAVLGLAKESTVVDYVASGVGALQLHTLGRRRLGGANVHDMPILDATMTYRQVARRAEALLPGVAYRRHPVFRYSLVWRKPA